MKQFARLIILADNLEKAKQFTWFLNKNKLAPTLLVVENSGISLKKRLKQRIKKYGLFLTLFWVLRVISSKFTKKENFNKKIKYGALLESNSVNDRVVIDSIKKIKQKLIINLTSSIICKEIIKLGQNRIFGVHPGILPRYVALSSVEWQVFDGKIPGFSIFNLTNKIDSGKVYLEEFVEPQKKETLASYRNRFIFEARKNFAGFVSKNYLRFVAQPIKLKQEKPLNRGLFPLKNYGKLNQQWKQLTNK